MALMLPPCRNFVIPRLPDGPSRPPYIHRLDLRALLAMAMPTLPTSLPRSAVPRCALRKPVRSTEPCARHTESESARSKNWALHQVTETQPADQSLQATVGDQSV